MDWIKEDDLAERYPGMMSRETYASKSYGIDLRDAFEDIIRDTGYYVLLRRTERKMHCSCWDPINQDADDQCIYCGGTGRVSIIERQLTRKTRTMFATTAPNNVVLANPSNFEVPSYTYYFRYDVHPRVQDLVYEVSWLDDNNPKVILAENEINLVEPLRDRRGRIEYYRASCSERPINKTIHSTQIRRLREYIEGEAKVYFSIAT